MSLTGGLKRFLEKATGLRIMRDLPFGNDRFHDLRRVFSQREVRTVVDVGAHVGNTAREFRRQWPQAVVHCCEPVPHTFAELSTNAAHPLNRFHQVAIGAIEGQLELHVRADHRNSDLSSFRDDHPALRGEDLERVAVPLMTLASFADEQGIGTIGHLKVDTVGYELEVVQGAERLFREGRIEVVDLELAVDPGNEVLVPLSRMQGVLADLGHKAFGIYDQVHEWPTRQPLLRRVNVLFIPERMASPGSWAAF